MDKLFTKSKKLLLSIFGAIVLLCISLTSLASEDYKPIIRYDRVWEALCFDVNYNYTVKYMRFAGTEDILGKTYHKLVTFKKLFGPYDFGLNAIVVKDTIDNIEEHEGYIREEDGVVYTLVFDNGKYRYDDWKNFRYVGQHYVPGKMEGEGEISEYVIYDFNRNIGESYFGVTFYTGSLRDTKIEFRNLAETTDFEICDRSTIVIDGEECRKVSVRPKYENYSYGTPQNYIEGVGADYSGCLNFHWLAWDWNDIETYNFFNRLFNEDGEVIYSKSWIIPIIEEDALVAVPTENKTSTSYLYDIFGRKISQPAPGQIYICNGKKMIGR